MCLTGVTLKSLLLSLHSSVVPLNILEEHSPCWQGKMALPGGSLPQIIRVVAQQSPEKG